MKIYTSLYESSVPNRAIGTDPLLVALLYILYLHSCLVTSNRAICSQPDTCTKLDSKNVSGLPNLQVTPVST